MSPQDVATSKHRRRPVPGKGFRKSRKGCYNCKRRRVKCSEDRPACAQCGRMDLVCDYPAAQPSTLASPLHAPSAHCSSMVLSFNDLRFFHHFLIAAYPSVPSGFDNFWKDVVAMAPEYDFLVHSILGMGAQHLTIHASANFSREALYHRVKAIQTLNKSLSQPCLSNADGDARRAAIMTLMFQSSYMPDGMMDFLSTLRGWMIISKAVPPDFEESSFRLFTIDAYVETMRNRISNPGEIDQASATALEDFSASLRTLAPHCRGVAEVQYLSTMENIVELAKVSFTEACLKLVPCIAMTNKLDDKEFENFIDSRNHTAQAVLAHFFMLLCLLDTAAFGARAQTFAFPRPVLLSWIKNVAKKVPSKYRHCMIWPAQMAALLEAQM
ncbi:uncharacterized protein F4812DRAFT_453763 [Daldinia caldariorum]|uniref:uncharacterized protein n=1 Tax=Daldinia caldariorum TaxID=326644 RepID=UPI002007FA2F|nr:uncharacterized protein F4812DRAFT_453763 [Daldinia caldariorum]KAI1463052.1 hypothetical protein F4812DRAFT_453763 [Daldinia caldariorum]